MVASLKRASDVCSCSRSRSRLFLRETLGTGEGWEHRATRDRRCRFKVCSNGGEGCAGVGDLPATTEPAGAGMEHLGRAQRDDPGAASGGFGDSCGDEAQRYGERGCVSSRCFDRQARSGAEVVVPGPHSWDGSYTEVSVSWKEHSWRVQSGRDGSDVVLLATPLPGKATSPLPATLVFSVDFLWNMPGTAMRRDDVIETRGGSGAVAVYCTCTQKPDRRTRDYAEIPVAGRTFQSTLLRQLA